MWLIDYYYRGAPFFAHTTGYGGQAVETAEQNIKKSANSAVRRNPAL
jgi:hypothetical protein